MEKPIQLSIEECKNNIVNFINEECKKNNIDYYFLFVILQEMFEEISRKKDEELKQLSEEYMKGETENGICEN